MQKGNNNKTMKGKHRTENTEKKQQDNRRAKGAVGETLLLLHPRFGDF
jgi:hypothetical protein